MTGLRKTTLAIPAGDFVAVVGPGGGKSTLLPMLGGMLSPPGGRVPFETHSLCDLSADEPTGNRDPETGQQVIDFLAELNAEGRSSVMVAHEPLAAERCKRTLRLRDGEIKTETSTRLAGG